MAGEADSGDLSSDLTDLLVATGVAAADRSAGLLIAIDEVQYLKAEELGAFISAIHRRRQSMATTEVKNSSGGLPAPGWDQDAEDVA